MRGVGPTLGEVEGAILDASTDMTCRLSDKAVSPEWGGGGDQRLE